MRMKTLYVNEDSWKMDVWMRRNEIMLWLFLLLCQSAQKIVYFKLFKQITDTFLYEEIANEQL